MDRALIMSYLQSAEMQVAAGEQDIADQLDLVSTLERTGHSATSATSLLHKLEQSQTQRIAERDWLRGELATLDGVDAAKSGADSSK